MEILDFVKHTTVGGKPWCILGKGPSFDRFGEVELDKYRTIGINDTLKIFRPEYVHFTDWNAFARVAEDLDQYPGKLIMPWHPHWKYRPNVITLAERAEGNATLRRFIREGRCFSYNSSLAPTVNPALTKVKVKGFSGVAVFNLLVAAKAKEIYSLGLDGGKSYSKFFDPGNILANGQSTFSVQDGEIELTCKTRKVKWIKL